MKMGAFNYYVPPSTLVSSHTPKTCGYGNQNLSKSAIMCVYETGTLDFKLL